MEFLPILAYLDPGTGSMILQLMIGAVVGMLYAIKSYWYKILSLFGMGKSADQEDGEG